MNENTTPAPTATTAAPEPTADYSATMPAKQAFGRAHAARFIARLGCLIDELEDYQADGHDPNGGPSGALAFTLDGILEAALGTRETEGLPGCAAPCRTWGGCSAFAGALFGEEIMPQPAREDAGAEAQTAFQIARAYLAAPMNSAGKYLLLAAAVAVHRDTVKREQEKNEPAAMA